MDKELLPKVITLGAVLILLIVMTACTSNPKKDQEPLFGAVGKSKEIGEALACVFAPASCDDTQKEADQDKSRPASK